MDIDTQRRRWRLILGESAEETMGGLTDETDLKMDEALSFLYNDTGNGGGSGGSAAGGGKKGGKNPSSLRIAKWMGDVRSLFSGDSVRIIQSDAIERKGLTGLLLEPETLKNITPDVNMVATILTMKNLIPEKSKDAVRELVNEVVEDIKRRLEQSLRNAVTGALNKKNHSPIANVSAMDFKRTISKNLKNYNTERGKILADKFYFFERQKKSSEEMVILAIDQSGSMADSVIYSGVMGSILASMPALDTKIIAFDTEIIDLSEVAKDDPVDVLFGIQLGGGTYINKAVEYCRDLIENPSKTIFILISDLYEGGVEKKLLENLEYMKESGVKVVTLLALSDQGKPSYDERLAKKIADLAVPCFACPPDKLPALIAAALKGNNLIEFAADIENNRK